MLVHRSTQWNWPRARRIMTQPRTQRAPSPRKWDGRASKLVRSALLVVRGRQDQGPEHAVLAAGRIDRRDAHVGGALEQHVGAVVRRVAPAGKRLGDGVVAGRDVFRRDLGVEAGT